MRPSKLWKTRTINLANEGEAPATLTIRLAQQEYNERLSSIDFTLAEKAQKAVREATDADGGVTVTADLVEIAQSSQVKSAIILVREAYVGTYLVGWSGWEDNDGKPLPDRDERDKIHTQNGSYLLSCIEIYERFDAEIKAMREALDVVIGDAAKNFEAPLAAN